MWVEPELLSSGGDVARSAGKRVLGGAAGAVGRSDRVEHLRRLRRGAVIPSAPERTPHRPGRSHDGQPRNADRRRARRRRPRRAGSPGPSTRTPKTSRTSRMPSYPQLVHLSVPELIGAAGGDPWQIDDTIQAGAPGEISELATSFHNAAVCTTQTGEEFAQAKKRFAQAWDRDDPAHPDQRRRRGSARNRVVAPEQRADGPSRRRPAGHRRRPRPGAAQRTDLDRQPASPAQADRRPDRIGTAGRRGGRPPAGLVGAQEGRRRGHQAVAG